MAKEAYYFSHDSNARNDDKIIAMRMRHGMEGYGIYWTIIERLRECDNYTSVKDYNVISYEIRVSADKVKSIVEDYGLFTFTDDGKRFYSESLNRRMDIKEEKSEKAREKAKKRWAKQNNDATAMLQHSHGNADAMQGKERKGKESKVIEPITDFSNGIPVKKPSFEEVHALFVRNGKGEAEAKVFYNHHEGLGWKKGITPIINWTAIANNWIANPISTAKQQQPAAGVKSFAAQVIANKQQNGQS